MKKEIEKVKERFLEIEHIFEEGDENYELIFELEESVQNLFQEAFEDDIIESLEKLNKRIKEFKRENNFFDAEAELDRMFPDRHDEGFDDESMSYDSVFGGD